MPGHRPQTWYFFFTLCGKIPLKVYLQVSICLKRSMYFLFLIYIIHWPLLSLQENFPIVLYLYICNRQLGTGWFSKNTCVFFSLGGYSRWTMQMHPGALLKVLYNFQQNWIPNLISWKCEEPQKIKNYI